MTMRGLVVTVLSVFALGIAAAHGSGCILVTDPGRFTIEQGGGGSCGDAGAMPTACLKCIGTSCCTEYAACTSTCLALSECAAGDMSCVDDNAAGKSALDALTTCVNASCAVCSQGGIGDPCTSGATCMKGLTCTGLWCTKGGCIGDSDCAGMYANGTNSGGTQNRCVLSEDNGTQVSACFPGCAETSQCSSFPDAECLQAESITMSTTFVCSLASDAGVSDGG
jgi:hypothetical protein